MRKVIRVALLLSAFATMILAAATFARSFLTVTTPTWALTVREITLHGWRAPHAPGYGATLALDDSGGVGKISAGGYAESRSTGFQSIVPFSTKDSQRCALQARGSDDHRTLGLRLLPATQHDLAHCASTVHFEGDAESSAPLEAGDELELQLRQNKLEFLSKPLEAQAISFVAESSFALEDAGGRCSVTAGSPVRLSGDELRLSRAQLGPMGLAVTLETRGKVTAKVGEYCSLNLGTVDSAAWLARLAALVTALTAGCGVLWGLSKEPAKEPAKEPVRRLILPVRVGRGGTRRWKW